MNIEEKLERDEEIKNAAELIDDATPEIEDGVSNPVKEKKKVDTKITDEMLEAEKEKISKMNFLALGQYKRGLDRTVEDMESTLFMINSLEDMEGKDDSFGSMVAKANISRDLTLDTKEEIKEFKDNYEENMAKIGQTREFIKKREEELNSVKKTSTYLNQCMLEVLAEKTVPLKEKTGKQFKNLKYYYNNLEEIFRNRDSMDFLKGQVVSNIGYVRRVVENIKKANRNGTSEQVADPIRENVVATFTEVFTVDQMVTFEKYIANLLSDEENLDVGYVCFLYQYLLYVIYKHEKDRHRGLHKWVEALIMNVLDIESGMYDLPKSREDLDKEIKEMIMLMLTHIH